MKLEKRSAFEWGASGAGYAKPRSGLVIHYDGSNQGLARKSHSACISYWKSTRQFHMGSSRGWADIGYSWGACPHGYVLEGRGLNRQQAAQPGGNSTWYSCTLMSGPGEDPTSEQINAVRELRAWLMGKGVAGAVRGHRDFISTSCPGDRLYRLVRDGTFGRAPSEEDDMPSAEEIARAVWKHPISNQFREDSKGNPRLIAAENFLEYGDAHHDEVVARLKAQSAAIAEMARAFAALAADRGQVVDSEEIARRVAAAVAAELDGITIHLDATTSAEDASQQGE